MNRYAISLAVRPLSIDLVIVKSNAAIEEFSRLVCQQGFYWEEKRVWVCPAAIRLIEQLPNKILCIEE